MNSDWSNIEVELIISDYFDMLSKELSGQKYIKSDHRRKLLPYLKKRSEGSIEFKHQNISASLIKLGQPYIKGYLPRFNYQKILDDKVINHLIKNKTIEKKFKLFVDKDIIQHSLMNNFNELIVDSPIISQLFEEPLPAYSRNPIQTNYLEKEQQNRKLGMFGEELVIHYEKWQLNLFGKQNLADEVRWVSKEDGDGAGFDILSRNLNGTDKYIEVKTTKLGKQTPFYFSLNELLFSQSKSENYHLYRLFNFEKNPRMFVKNGTLDSICTAVPISFKGYF